MKKFLKEFRDFAVKGNAFNLAVGVIIGAAFQTIIASLTNDIINPIIGIFAKKDFSNIVFTVPYFNVSIRYGAFITTVINFIIMAFAVFLIVKAVNKMTELFSKKEETVEESNTKECVYCKSEIRKDAVKCPFCTSKLDD